MKVLVTGAASGLGAALAAAFRARGDDVLATDLPGASIRPSASASAHSTSGVSGDLAGGVSGDLTSGVSGSRPSASVDRVPPRGTSGGVSRSPEGSAPTEFFPLDVTREDDWVAAREHVEQMWGGLDILVNNAGVAGGGRIELCDLDEWEWITGINLFGAVRGTRTFVPMLKEQGSGHIVNIASLAGLVHPAGMGSYNAVKAAVVAFSETAQHELAGDGIAVSVVCPSYFRTNLTASMRSADAAVGTILGRLVDSSPTSAEQVAAAVLAGVDAGEFLILPDPAARQAYALKLTNRVAYDRLMQAQAAKLKEADK